MAKHLIKTAVVTCLSVVALSAYIKHQVTVIDGVAQKQAVDLAKGLNAVSEQAKARLDQQTADREAATQRIRAKVAERQAEIAAASQAEVAAASQAASARDAAWRRYYQRPKQCDNPPTDSAFIECSNRAIAARKQFEKTYQP